MSNRDQEEERTRIDMALYRSGVFIFNEYVTSEKKKLSVEYFDYLSSSAHHY